MILQNRKCKVLISFIITILLPAQSTLPAPSQTESAEPQEFLRKFIHLEASDFATLDKGGALAKMLVSSQPTEVVPFGIIRVRISRNQFLERYRDIENFKKGKEVIQIGRFHSPPRIEDLQPLTLDSSEIESLKKCRSGDCAIKASTEMIDRFQKEINWSAPDHAAQALALYRSMLLAYVHEYLRAGNSALMVYADKKTPASLPEELESLLQASPYLAQYLPEFKQYLAEFPKEPLKDSEDFLYWSKESFGYKTVVSITHVTILLPSPGTTVIASKQIYANHYFVASLGLAAFVESPQQAGGAGSYLMYLNRSRVDVIQGFFSAVLRYFVKRRVLDGMDKYLRVIKERLESDIRQP